MLGDLSIQNRDRVLPPIHYSSLETLVDALEEKVSTREGDV